MEICSCGYDRAAKLPTIITIPIKGSTIILFSICHRHFTIHGHSSDINQTLHYWIQFLVGNAKGKGPYTTIGTNNTIHPMPSHIIVSEPIPALVEVKFGLMTCLWEYYISLQYQITNCSIVFAGVAVMVEYMIDAIWLESADSNDLLLLSIPMSCWLSSSWSRGIIWTMSYIYHDIDI